MMTTLQLVRPTKPAQGTTQRPPLDEPAHESTHALCTPLFQRKTRGCYMLECLYSFPSQKTRNAPTFPDMRFRRSGRQAQAGHVRRSFTFETRPWLPQQLCLLFARLRHQSLSRLRHQSLYSFITALFEKLSIGAVVSDLSERRCDNAKASLLTNLLGPFLEEFERVLTVRSDGITSCTYTRE